MSQQNQNQSIETADQASVAANIIRQSIAHFFGSDNDDRTGTTVPSHTLRDIGVDRTVYDYL